MAESCNVTSCNYNKDGKCHKNTFVVCPSVVKDGNKTVKDYWATRNHDAWNKKFKW